MNEMKSSFRNKLSEIGKALVSFGRLIIGATGDVIRSIIYFIDNNLSYISVILEIALPYLILYKEVDIKKNEWFAVVPVLYLFIVFVLRRISIRRNKGYVFPIPKKRFTKDVGNGEIQIDEKDLQEVILYLNDVENFLEKNNMLKK